MKAVIQRVTEASVEIEGKINGEIGSGYLILLGIEEADEKEDADWLANKICTLRIFNDNQNNMNLALADVDGKMLVVSQFTLHAKTKKGTRPSFIRAAKPDQAIPLYNYFIEVLETTSKTKVETGIFGADMKVRLLNDGPLTIIIDTKNKS
jgi:D-tyrosyl-tRNA(Tyr) deacylase